MPSDTLVTETNFSKMGFMSNKEVKYQQILQRYSNYQENSVENLDTCRSN